MKRICIFCGSSVGLNTKFENSARSIARLLVKKKIELVYGGAKIGLMGIIADEVIKNNGSIIGVIPEALNNKEIIHQNLSNLYIVKSMHKRKNKMYNLSDAFIALPGGIGTLEELAEIITWKGLNMKKSPIGILNVNGYYNELINFFNVMNENNFASSNIIKEVIVSDSPDYLVKNIIRNIS